MTSKTPSHKKFSPDFGLIAEAQARRAAFSKFERKVADTIGTVETTRDPQGYFERAAGNTGVYVHSVETHEGTQGAHGLHAGRHTQIRADATRPTGTREYWVSNIAGNKHYQVRVGITAKQKEGVLT